MGKILSLCALVGLLTISSNAVNSEEIIAKYTAKKFGDEIANITYSLAIYADSKVEKFNVTTPHTDPVTKKTKDTTDSYLRVLTKDKHKYFANNSEIIIPEGCLNPFQLSDTLNKFTDTTSTEKYFKIQIDKTRKIEIFCKYIGQDSIQLEEGSKHHVNIYKIKLKKPFKWRKFTIDEVTLYANNISTMKGTIKAKIRGFNLWGLLNVDAKINSLNITYDSSN